MDWDKAETNSLHPLGEKEQTCVEGKGLNEREGGPFLKGKKGGGGNTAMHQLTKKKNKKKEGTIAYEKQGHHRLMIDTHSTKAEGRGETHTFLHPIAESQSMPKVISQFFDCRLSFFIWLRKLVFKG